MAPLTFEDTRYAAKLEWERKKIKTGHLPPLRPASEALCEALDLSHYGRTNIFTDWENGWHYAKSVTYDEMAAHRAEMKREKKEMRGIRQPKKPRGSSFYLAQNARLETEEKREERERREKKREERIRRIAEGRAHSDDEEEMEKERRERKKEAEQEALDALDKLNPSPLRPRPLLPGMRSGETPWRDDVKGEKRVEEIDKSESVLRLTPLIGFRGDFACFYMSGEPYLVLGQILMQLMKHYVHDPVRLGAIMQKLNVITRPPTRPQMAVLRRTNIMNWRTVISKRISVELIRRSDASRVLGEYLPLHQETKMGPKPNTTLWLRVQHDCQGTATGMMNDDCGVLCEECEELFKPDAFVCHSHETTETNNVIHWGFDPTRWRDYINLHPSEMGDKRKVKRFFDLISEPIIVQIEGNKDENCVADPYIVNLNPDYNKRAPSPYRVTVDRIGERPLAREAEEDRQAELIEITVEEARNTVERRRRRRKGTVERKNLSIAVLDDDEVQIIGEQKAPKKDDFLFKVPDLFATTRSRQYTEAALKGKGVDINELIAPRKEVDSTSLQLQLQSLLQPTSVFAAVAAAGFDPFRSLADFVSAAAAVGREGIGGGQHKEGEESGKTTKLSFPAFAEPYGRHHHPALEKALEYSKDPSVQHLQQQQPQKPQHVRRSSVAESLPGDLDEYTRGLEASRRREERARKLDEAIASALSGVPSSVSDQLAALIKSREEVRNEMYDAARENTITLRTKYREMEDLARFNKAESEMYYDHCKKLHVPLPVGRPEYERGKTPPILVPPVRLEFPAKQPQQQRAAVAAPAITAALNGTAPPAAAAAAAPAAVPTSVSAAAAAAAALLASPRHRQQPPQQVNGGRSMSMSGISPIGIHGTSMMGQPGPTSNGNGCLAVPGTSSGGPLRTPTKVGQRGRPRGSGAAGYQRKHSMGAAQTAAAAAAAADARRHQLQQAEYAQQLRQLQQQQALLQQGYTLQPQPQQHQPATSMAMMTGTGTHNGTSPTLLQYGSASQQQMQLTSLLASLQQPVQQQQAQLQQSPQQQQQLLLQLQMQQQQLQQASPSLSNNAEAVSAATAFARMQEAVSAAVSVAGPSGHSTPAATPASSVLQQHMQQAAAASHPTTPALTLDLSPEALQKLLQQSAAQERQQQQQLLLQPAAAAAQQLQQEQDMTAALQAFLAAQQQQAAAAAAAAAPPPQPEVVQQIDPSIPIVDSSTIQAMLDNPDLFPHVNLDAARMAQQAMQQQLQQLQQHPKTGQ